MQTVTLTSPRHGYPLLRLDGDAHNLEFEVLSFEGVVLHADELLLLADTTSTGLEEMTGSAVAAAHRSAQDVRAQVQRLRTTAAELRWVLSLYQRALEQAQTAMDPLVPEIEDAHELVQQRRTERDEAEESDREDAQTALDEAREDLADLWERYETHVATWREAYERALDGVALAEPIEPSTAPADPATLAGWLAALVGSDPEQVQEAWLALTPRQQQALALAYPEVVGNLDGVPYDVRAEINLQVLLAADEISYGDPLDHQIDLLLAEVENGASIVSLRLDAADQATAALLYGDLSTATDVNVLVPGMNTDLSGIADWGESAIALNEGAEALKPDVSSATVVWFGYDTPDPSQEPFMGHADEGAGQLTGFLGGLNLERADASELAVIAHSYGSTTAAEAIGSAADSLDVDQLITVGSAGIPGVGTNLWTDSAGATDLVLDDVDVFSTAADGDFWSFFGQFSAFGHDADPEELPGTVVFDSDGGYAELLDADGNPTGLLDTSQPLDISAGHGTHEFDWAADFGGAILHPFQIGWDAIVNPSDAGAGYLQDGSESFYNISYIVANGQPWTSADHQPGVPR